MNAGSTSNADYFLDCLLEIGEGPTVQGTSEHSKYRQILGQKIVHLLALFSLVYVGIEFTIGGVRAPFQCMMRDTHICE